MPRRKSQGASDFANIAVPPSQEYSQPACGIASIQTIPAGDGRRLLRSARHVRSGQACAISGGERRSMAVNLKRLVYFDSFMDPIANTIIGRRDDIDLVRLEYNSSERDNWQEISQAHGYQIQPRGELRDPWFGDAALLARCPN